MAYNSGTDSARGEGIIVRSFIVEHEAAIFFVYGLAYFSMGAALLAIHHRPSRLQLIKALPWLGAYGIAHALFKWSEVLELLGLVPFSGSPLFRFAQQAVLAVAVALLLRFAVELLSAFYPQWSQAKKLPLMLLVGWIVVFPTALFAGKDVRLAADYASIFARYFIYAPACLLAGLAFAVQYRSLRLRNLKHVAVYLLPVASLLLLNVPLVMMLVPKAPWPPASVLNQELAAGWLGFPPSILKGLLAVGLTTFVLLGMRVFDQEGADLLDRHERELEKLDQLTARVATARMPAKIMPGVLEDILSLLSLNAGAIFVQHLGSERPAMEAAEGLVDESSSGAFAKLFRPNSLLLAVMEARASMFGPVAERSDLGAILRSPEEHHSFALVPLAAKRQCMGALLVFTPRGVALDAEDERVLRTLGSQLGIALDDALLEEQRGIAHVLQQSLLSPTPSVQGLEVAVHYEPATQGMIAGGDFYDFIQLGEGRLGVVCGDVSGKGLNAAALTGLVKNVMRAFLSENPSPASVLERTNRVLCRATTFGQFVTALVIVLNKDCSFTYAHAGHPPLLLIGRDQCRYLLGGRGLPLGTFEDITYSEERDRLEEDVCLGLYTDGLTEARAGLELFGEDGLLEAAERVRGKSAIEAVRGIVSETIGFAEGQLQDDIALIIIRRAGRTVHYPHPVSLPRYEGVDAMGEETPAREA